jgi:hypothetical protein
LNFLQIFLWIFENFKPYLSVVGANAIGATGRLNFGCKTEKERSNILYPKPTPLHPPLHVLLGGPNFVEPRLLAAVRGLVACLWLQNAPCKLQAH